MSSAFDLNTLSSLTTVWGTSSLFFQVTAANLNGCDAYAAARAVNQQSSPARARARWYSAWYAVPYGTQIAAP